MALHAQATTPWDCLGTADIQHLTYNKIIIIIIFILFFF